MSMCGEVENLQYQIKQKEMQLEDLKARLTNLNKIINNDRQLNLDLK